MTGIKTSSSLARGFTPAACLLLLISAFLGGTLVATIGSARDAARAPRPSDAAFKAALKDVMWPDAADVASELWPLSADAPRIAWDRREGVDRVLMATFTGYDGYDGRVGALSDELAIDVWVSPVPQLQERCRSFGLSGATLDRRLRQYLGLGPSGTQDRVVELWVNTRDLFRPCPDPEIDDRSCRLGLPAIPENATADDLEHARWFAERFASYANPGALPWTRLGYTYDWGSSGSKVGASEYVIRKGTRVWIASVSTAANYCKQGGPSPDRKPPASAPASAATEDDAGSKLASGAAP